MSDSSSSFGRGLGNYKLWQWLLLAYWLALLVATHLPKDSPVLPKDQWDKVVHVAAFALLAALLATTWHLAAGQLTICHFTWAWIVIAVYAAMDEWTQLYAGRYASSLDWLADAAGAAAGLAVFAWWSKRLQPT